METLGGGRYTGYGGLSERGWLPATGSGSPGAGEGSLCEEGAARPSQWGGGGSRSGLMSKSMPFLGASIFLKGNWLSEGEFPVPSESQPEKGVCTNHSCDWERGTLVWWLDLQPVVHRKGLLNLSWVSVERTVFSHLPQQSGLLPTPGSGSAATHRKAPLPGSSPSLGLGRGRPLSFPLTPSLKGSRRGPLYSDARQAWLPLI